MAAVKMSIAVGAELVVGVGVAAAAAAAAAVVDDAGGLVRYRVHREYSSTPEVASSWVLKNDATPAWASVTRCDPF